jgi:hypothetical protein
MFTESILYCKSHWFHQFSITVTKYLRKSPKKKERISFRGFSPWSLRPTTWEAEQHGGEHVVEQSCLSHDGGEAEKERKRCRLSKISFKGTTPVTPFPYTRPYLLKVAPPSKSTTAGMKPLDKIHSIILPLLLFSRPRFFFKSSRYFYFFNFLFIYSRVHTLFGPFLPHTHSVPSLSPTFASMQNLFSLYLQFCWREDISNNKIDKAVLLVEIRTAIQRDS